MRSWIKRVSCLCWGLTFLWIWEDFFFGGFNLLGLVLDLKLRLVFDFVLTLIFGMVLDGRFVDLDLNIQNELICCVLLSLNENLFWLLVPFKVYFFIFIIIIFFFLLGTCSTISSSSCLFTGKALRVREKDETEGDRWEKEESFGIELKIGNGVICRLGLRTEVVSF